ncbi:MAG: hypothetical protein KC621_04005 [Myxococcales bacterium]|nr:hypothetical protein [Myxococcales bacterium]
MLLREAARTSRRWQTYAARAGFSGVLLAVLLAGFWAAVSATRTSMVDTANLAWLGRGLFIGFSVVQMLMAMGLAPLMTAGAIAEETDERTMEMLVLTRLSPSQILLAKILSRILTLVTIVAGALPVMALVVNLGGVSAIEVLAVTVHTLTTIAIMSVLGAFFALFTKSPTLAAAASACYAVPFFLMLPAAYVLCTGDPYASAHFSTFAAPSAREWSALVTPLSYVPSLVLTLAVTTPLFQHKVSNASFEQVFSEQVWRTSTWLRAGGAWFVVGLLLLPWAAPTSWWLASSGAASTGIEWRLFSGLLGLILWLYWSFGAALGTWAFLRVGMDVVDGIDAVFSGTQGMSVERERKSASVGNNPVWWREARVRAWMSNTTPVFVLWGLFLLGVFQTGWWLIPGGMLSVGALNAGAAVVLASWLATRSIAEERRRGTFEVLLCTTLPSHKIVSGKVAAAALPTLPLLLLSLPLLAIGVPQLLSMVGKGGHSAPEYFVRGFASFVWLVPLWMLAIASSLAVAVRSSRPASAFGLVTVGMLGVFGLPSVLARIFPDNRLVTIPAGVVAPPLAGEFTWPQIVLSTIFLSLAAASVLTLLTSRLRTWTGLMAALLAVGLAVHTVPASAAAPSAEEIAAMEKLFKLRMTARPLADGWVREGDWTTIAVQVDNLGAATVGTIELVETALDASTPRTYRRDLELPAGTRKVVTMLVVPGINLGDRTLSLTTREGRQAVAPLRFQSVSEDDVVVAVIGNDPLGLPAELTDATQEPVPGRRFRGRASGDRRVRTGLVAPAAMPHHSRGWATVDEIVWPAADPSSLGTAEVEALIGWVADGGHLVLTVSDTWRQVAASPLANALPVELVGLSDADVSPLAGALGASGGGTAPLAEATVRQDALVRARAADGRPLWVVAARGMGTIQILLTDPRSSALDGLRSEGPLRRLLTLPAPGGMATDMLARDPAVSDLLVSAMHLQHTQTPPISVHDDSQLDLQWESEVRDLLSNIPGVAPLPLHWLVLFSVGYLALIGPVDYFFLRAIGRQPLTWITFPIWIAVFAGGSLILTSVSKGSQAVVVHVEVVDLLPDIGLMRGNTWLGVFSTRKTTLSIESHLPDAVISPMTEAGYQNDTVIVAGDGGGRVGYRAETWTLAYLRSEWTQAAQGRVTVERADGGFVVRNDLPYDLQTAAVLFPDEESVGRVSGLVVIGPLPRGSEARISDPPVISAIPGPGDLEIGDAPDVAALARLFGYALPRDRGSIDAEHRPVLIGTVARPFEDLTIRGLDPDENRTIVLRVPLPELASISVDTSSSTAEVVFEELLEGVSTNLMCGDEDSHTVAVLDGTVTTLRTDLMTTTCSLSLWDMHGNYVTVSVDPGRRYACRRSPGNDEFRCEESP